MGYPRGIGEATGALPYIYRIWRYVVTRNKAYIESYDVTCNVYLHSTELHNESHQMKSMKGFEMNALALCVLEMEPPERKFARNDTSSFTNDFEKLLIEAVDEGLSSLGDSGQEAIYFHLKSTFEIEKHEIPDKIEAFAKALEEIFGGGAKLIQIRIIEALHERVNQFKYFPKQGDLVFTEYLAALRRFVRSTV